VARADEVGMPAKSDPRNAAATTEYFYRRSLGGRHLLAAIGVGVAAGLTAFYLTKIMLERTPLAPDLVASRRQVRAARTHGG
jgi:hypothetical protein